jgi:hypothetical protein
VKFSPKTLSRANQQDELQMAGPNGAHLNTRAGESLIARATLNDGRLLEVKVTVDASRPQLELMNKTVQPGTDESATSLSFGNPEELPQDARLSFVLKSVSPAAFPADEKIEVATQDEAFKVMLSVQDGNLALLDSKTIMAVLEPMKHLGPSAFGALKFRPVAAGAINGDWQPLVSLVRIPQIKGVRCGSAAEKQCTLVGEKLYLINSVSADKDFSNPVEVPDGFLSSALPIPRPKGKTLYVKLRDNPSEVNTVALPATDSE